MILVTFVLYLAMWGLGGYHLFFGDHIFGILVIIVAELWSINEKLT